jgi:hypothetical protein
MKKGAGHPGALLLARQAATTEVTIYDFIARLSTGEERRLGGTPIRRLLVDRNSVPEPFKFQTSPSPASMNIGKRDAGVGIRGAVDADANASPCARAQQFTLTPAQSFCRDFNAAVLHVRRVKNGTSSTHPLLGDELKAHPHMLRHSCGYAAANKGPPRNEC